MAYSGIPLISDTDYSWTVVWADSHGILSVPATATFSTAILYRRDWRGAAWVMANSSGKNVLRATFTTAPNVAVVRARLYICGLGYAKAFINGARTDVQELGSFTTFEKRALYETFDVTALVRPGETLLLVRLDVCMIPLTVIRHRPKRHRRHARKRLVRAGTHNRMSRLL